LIRYGVAIVPFVILLVAREGWSSLRLEGHTLRVLWLGAAGFAGFNFLVYIGLQSSRPQNASILMAMFPLFTALALWARFRRRPTRATTVAIAVAIVGAVLVVSRGQVGELARLGWGGDLLILAGVLCWVAYTMGPADLPDWSPLRFTTLTVLLGLVPIALGTALATGFGYVETPSISDLRTHLPALLYMSVAAAVLATRAWASASRHLGAQNTALFMNLVPIVAFAVEIGRGYRPTGLELVGGALVLAALIGHNLHARSRRPHPPAGAAAGTT
jgi:drug/metabolite transporter (DMT)-like permease